MEELSKTAEERKDHGIDAVASRGSEWVNSGGDFAGLYGDSLNNSKYKKMT